VTYELGVVVPSLGRARPRETVESIHASAEAAGISTEIALAWQSGEAAPPLPSSAHVVDVLPLGVSYARNRGAASVTAPIVAFVDDDELVDPGWVRALSAAFAAAPDIGAVCGAIEPLDDRGLAYCRFSGGEERRFSGANALPWTVGSSGNMAVRRHVLVELRAFDVAFGAGTVARSAEDTDFIKRVLTAGYDILWTPDAVVYHPTKTEQERLDSRTPYGFGMGKLARRHRDVRGAAAYAGFGMQSYVTGLAHRDRRRRREAAATLRAFVAGACTRTESIAPVELLRRAPASVREVVDLSRAIGLAVQYRPNPHFVYAVDDDHVLHVYSSPAEELRTAVVERELIRTRSKVDGIPRMLTWTGGPDSLWLVEERLRAAAKPDPPPLRATLEWATAMAKPPGSVLRESDCWPDLRAVIAADAPGHVRALVAAASGRLGALASAHSHGDFQPKNIVFSNGSIQVFDWEWARARDLPGADLLFYAVTVGDDFEVVRALAHGAEPFDVPLRPFLAELGVGNHETVRDLLLVVLVRWAGNERRRLAQFGTRPQPARYARLLERCLPALVDVDPARSS
jgi:hypothetical protein